MTRKAAKQVSADRLSHSIEQAAQLLDDLRLIQKTLKSRPSVAHFISWTAATWVTLGEDIATHAANLTTIDHSETIEL